MPQVAAGVRYAGDALERWKSDHYGMVDGGRQHKPGEKLRQLHSPIVLSADRDAAAAAWRAADSGEAHGCAYNLPARGGWWWLGTVDSGSWSVVLTISPDGARSAERYSANDPESTEAENWLTEGAQGSADAPTPAAFVKYLKVPESVPAQAPPVQMFTIPTSSEVVKVNPAPAVPARRSLRWERRPIARPVTPLQWVAAELEITGNNSAQDSPPISNTRRGWLRRQWAAIVAPWLAAEPPTLQLPRVVRLDLAAAEND
jgi:hypothetical protein